MKALPWIIAGVAFGAAAYYIANTPDARYSDPDVEDAAFNTGVWGSKQRIKGGGGSVLGKAKEGFGKITGDTDLQAEGAGDQVVGAVKDTVGKAANAVSSTLHDLNRA